MKILSWVFVVGALIPCVSCQDTTATPPSASPPDAVSGVTPQPESGPATSAGIGKPAPDFTVTDLKGNQVKLSSLRGKPVYLDFWATWCPPCRKSLPHTQKVALNHPNEITVLAISDESADKITAFMKENNYSYPAYRDPDDTAARLYKVEGIPTFVVIDAKGNLVDIQSGYGTDAPLDEALAKVGIKA